jgi:putative flippase GtrA
VRELLLRWGKFSLVGGMGSCLQLGALALLNHFAPVHYLYASTAAIELALIHNFVWHLHFTWRDRERDAGMGALFVRFHLSNGLISLAGNLIVMRLLAGYARMPVVAANAAAIGCCGLLNFWAGNKWVFASGLPFQREQ